MSSLAPPALSGKRVLIIEDTEENMRLFNAILRLEEAQVLEAQLARIGIEIASREQPDLILMDLQMPGMDGLTATRHLRSDPRTKHIPIVVITASAMEDDRRRAFEAGCDGYITKPIDPLEFGRKLATFLQAKKTENAPENNERYASL
jgi:CheY-like chemotaxis protein